jgi:hypothetical protein
MPLKHMCSVWLLGCSAILAAHNLFLKVGRGVGEADGVHWYQLLAQEIPRDTYFLMTSRWATCSRSWCFDWSCWWSRSGNHGQGKNSHAPCVDASGAEPPTDCRPLGGSLMVDSSRYKYMHTTSSLIGTNQEQQASTMHWKLRCCVRKYSTRTITD